MAGKEETETTGAPIENADPVSADRAAYLDSLGPIDERVRDLALSELHNRVLVARTWRAQGMVCKEPLTIVRDACAQFLSDTKDEAEELREAPYVPPTDPCEACGGREAHKPSCSTLKR